MKDYPSGTLGPQEFIDICQRFFPDGDASRFASLFYCLFEHDQQGYVGFAQFMDTLSVVARGTLEEKIAWTFRLYDQDGDGYVTKDDMLHVVDSIYEMVDPHSDIYLDGIPQVERVEEIFNRMDQDDDDVLSLKDFVEGCKADENILKVLSSFSRFSY